MKNSKAVKAEDKEKGWFPPSCENLEIVDMTELFTNGQLAITMANNALRSSTTVMR